MCEVKKEARGKSDVEKAATAIEIKRGDPISSARWTNLMLSD
jgi:hypothetical protein